MRYASKLGIKELDFIPQIASEEIAEYDDQRRKKIRKKFDLEGKIVFGYIATFTKGGICDLDKVIELYEKIEIIISGIKIINLTKLVNL